MGHLAEDADCVLGPGSSLRLLLGLWWPEGRWYRLRGLLLASLSQGGTLWLMAGAAMKLYMDRPEDPEELALCSMVAILCFGHLIKNVTFIMVGATLRQIVKKLSDIRKEYGQEEDSENIRKRYLGLTERMFFHFQVMCVSVVTSWVCAPVVSSLFKNSNKNSTQKRQYPLPIWGPQSIYASPTYEILYFLQSISTLGNAQCMLCTDILFFHLMLVVTAELEILNNNIAEMHDGLVETAGGKEDIPVFGCETNAHRTVAFISGDSTGYETTFSTHVSFDESYHQLSKFVGHHRSVVRCVSLLQSAMSVSIYILLAINMANLCFVMFLTVEVFQRENSLGKVLKTVLIMPTLLYQTWMYCIFGQIITDQSERLESSLFGCGWPDRDSRFKHSLRFFMLATSRPLRIRVGKTCDLSRELLLQVMNGTYGLLNLLLHVIKAE